MKKIKVIHIIHNLEIGGVETAILSSLNDLNIDFDFTLICIGSIKPDILSKLNSEILKKTFQINSITNLCKCLVMIKKNSKYPIILSSLWKAHLFHGVLNLLLNPSHSIVILHSAKFAHLLDRLGILIGLKFASEIWADSQSTLKFISPYISSKKTTKKISFLLQHYTPKIKSQNKKKEFKFIFLGRISQEKRLDLSVKFINELKQRGLNISLDIFGPDNQTWESLSKYINALNLNNLIKYKGICPFEETPNLLSQYDAFVLMSDYEGMSISTVQAMEIGLLCFLRNVGEIANYGENMVNSVILKSEQPDDWQEFIENSVNVLNNQTLQKTILSNSTAKFANQLTYTQDIIQNLKRLSTNS